MIPNSKQSSARHEKSDRVIQSRSTPWEKTTIRLKANFSRCSGPVKSPEAHKHVFKVGSIPHVSRVSAKSCRGKRRIRWVDLNCSCPWKSYPLGFCSSTENRERQSQDQLSPERDPSKLPNVSNTFGVGLHFDVFFRHALSNIFEHDGWSRGVFPSFSNV